MTQRIFDIENKKDMTDLWDILPDDVDKIEKYPDGVIAPFAGFCAPSMPVGMCRSLIKINWHDKTEITRPIQEATEADLGKWCCFWDNCCEDVMIGKLSVIVRDRGKLSYRLGGYAVFDHCRRLTKKEIEELI